MGKINKFNIIVSDDKSTENEIVDSAYPGSSGTTVPSFQNSSNVTVPINAQSKHIIPVGRPRLCPKLQSNIDIYESTYSGADTDDTHVATPKAIREYFTAKINSNDKIEFAATPITTTLPNTYGQIISGHEFNADTNSLDIKYKTIVPTSNRIKITESENELKFNYVSEDISRVSSKLQGGSQFDETNISFIDNWYESSCVYTCAFMPEYSVATSDNLLKITHNLCSDSVMLDIYDHNGNRLLKTEYIANTTSLNNITVDLSLAFITHPITRGIDANQVWKAIVIADDKKSYRSDYLVYRGRFNASTSLDNENTTNGTFETIKADLEKKIKDGSISLQIDFTNSTSSTFKYPYYTVSKRGIVTSGGKYKEWIDNSLSSETSRQFEVNDTITIISCTYDISNNGVKTVNTFNYVVNDPNWAPFKNTAYTKIFSQTDLIQNTLILKHKLYKDNFEAFNAISIIDNDNNIVSPSLSDDDPKKYDILNVSGDVVTIRFPNAETHSLIGNWKVLIVNPHYRTDQIIWDGEYFTGTTFSYNAWNNFATKTYSNIPGGVATNFIGDQVYLVNVYDENEKLIDAEVNIVPCHFNSNTGMFDPPSAMNPANVNQMTVVVPGSISNTNKYRILIGASKTQIDDLYTIYIDKPFMKYVRKNVFVINANTDAVLSHNLGRDYLGNIIPSTGEIAHCAVYGFDNYTMELVIPTYVKKIDNDTISVRVDSSTSTYTTRFLVVLFEKELGNTTKFTAAANGQELTLSLPGPYAVSVWYNNELHIPSNIIKKAGNIVTVDFNDVSIDKPTSFDVYVTSHDVTKTYDSNPIALPAANCVTSIHNFTGAHVQNAASHNLHTKFIMAGNYEEDAAVLIGHHINTAEQATLHSESMSSLNSLILGTYNDELIRGNNQISRMAFKLFTYNELNSDMIKFTHNLHSVGLIVEVYDTQRKKILPSKIRVMSYDTIIIEMPKLYQFNGVYTIVVIAHGNKTAAIWNAEAVAAADVAASLVSEDLKSDAYNKKLNEYKVMAPGCANGSSLIQYEDSHNRVRCFQFTEFDIDADKNIIVEHGLETANLAIGVIDTIKMDYVESGYSIIPNGGYNKVKVNVGSITYGIVTIAGGVQGEGGNGQITPTISDSDITRFCFNGRVMSKVYSNVNGNYFLQHPFNTHLTAVNIDEGGAAKILPTELITNKQQIQIIYPNTGRLFRASVFAKDYDETDFIKTFTGWSSESIPICANMQEHLSDFNPPIDSFIYTNWSYDIAVAKIDIKYLSNLPDNTNTATETYGMTVGLYAQYPEYFGNIVLKSDIEKPVDPLQISTSIKSNDYGEWSQINYVNKIESYQYAWFEHAATLKVYAEKVKLIYEEQYNSFTPIKLRMFYDKINWKSNVYTIGSTDCDYVWSNNAYTYNVSSTPGNYIVTLEYYSGSWSSDLHSNMTLFSINDKYYGDKDNPIILTTTPGTSLSIKMNSGSYLATNSSDFKLTLTYRVMS